MNLPQMTVRVDSQLECVPLAESLVRIFCESAGATPAESRQMEVCVAEAMNNCVIHSYKRRPGNTVELSATKINSELVFEVSDWGTQMDPAELDRRRAQLLDNGCKELNELQEGGRGLSIIQFFMDAVEYESLENKNRLTMTKRVSDSVGAVK